MQSDVKYYDNAPAESWRPGGVSDASKRLRSIDILLAVATIVRRGECVKWVWDWRRRWKEKKMKVVNIVSNIILSSYYIPPTHSGIKQTGARARVDYLITFTCVCARVSVSLWLLWHPSVAAGRRERASVDDADAKRRVAYKAYTRLVYV